VTEELPEGMIARIDVTDAGVRVNLREGVTRQAMVATLRLLADGFENGTIERVDVP
jgi:hypothetical protein